MTAFAAALFLAGLGASQSVAQPVADRNASPPALHAAATTPAADGAALYAQRCAACHDNASDRTPAREVLAQNRASFILAAMRGGSMAPMAAGLTQAEMEAIARHVSKVRGDAELTDIDPRRIWGDSVEGTPLDAPKCTKAPPPIDFATQASWNGWSPTVDNRRYQANPGLTAADVPRLKLKWAFQYPGAKNGQATIIGDRLFTTSMSGAVYALDAKTGCVYWRHAAGAATRTSPVIAPMANGELTRAALFFSDWTKSAVALDAQTGEQIWKTTIDEQPGVQMTGSITYWDGKIFVPISSGNEAFAQSPNWVCCKFRGALVALDAATGAILWKRYTSDELPRPFAKNRAGKDLWGPSGGAIWVTPTVDPKRRLIYVGTSNSYTDLAYEHSDSVLAIDVDSGAIRWARQLTANDNYIDGCWREGDQRPANCPSPLGPDFSIGAAVILHTDKNGQERLLVGQKSGVLRALAPDSGAILWQRQLSNGSALGGIEFGTAADGERVYAGVSDIVLGKNGKPGLWALDVTNGEVVWNQPTSPEPECRWKNFWCHGAISQAISVVPGIVFAGSYDGHFRAYDAKTGAILWDFDTASKPVRALNGAMVYGGVMDGAGPTIAGGTVYVHSGYAGRSGATAGRNMRNADGNVLMAFSVDGK
ncbi:PQQ-binding-like beta-propeller repeat protein [Parafrankia sp. BMG5.11]|uniref:outer membrane protein assembly factor BamB family protein n=1 Tax=Parafrankia sp. BMG5.11 TaxID=222540 RepID=UPI0027D300C9|nr:PQQ-binding-like beta-propeller repeat protein [Parafrankia sp. BMG5.11]